MYYYSLFCLSDDDPSPGLCLFAQVCKRKNPISEPRLDLTVIPVTSRYEHNTLPVNSENDRGCVLSPLIFVLKL